MKKITLFTIVLVLLFFSLASASSVSEIKVEVRDGIKHYTYEPPKLELEEMSCYELGYLHGFCTVQRLHDLPCELEHYFAMPGRCVNKGETRLGIKYGVRDANLFILLEDSFPNKIFLLKKGMNE